MLNKHKLPFLNRFLTVSGVAYALLATSAYAGSTVPEIKPTPVGAIQGNQVTGVANNLVATAVNILIFLAGAAAIGYVIWGGVKFITAGGDPKKAEEGRKTVINAMIGVAIITAAYFIIQVAIGGGSALTTTGNRVLNF